MNEPYGWYEHLLTPRLETVLTELAERQPEYLRTVPDEEGLKGLLIRHLKPLLGASLEDQEPEEAVRTIASIIQMLAIRHPELLREVPRAELLQALLDPRITAQGQTKSVAEVTIPRTGFTSSELFTGRGREIALVDELRREIRSASGIDLVISFLRWSGLRLLIDDLKQASDRGVAIRVITTVYLGATETRAVTALHSLGAEVFVSFNTLQGRLHAKAWIFHRPRNLGTTYVGSSNMSKDALTDGLEWNIKATQSESSTLFRRTADNFEALTLDPEFERYQPDLESRLSTALTTAHSDSGSIRLRDLPVDLRRQVREHLQRTTPQEEWLHNPPVFRAQGFQQEVLDRLHGERSIHQRFRNLVVLPTGTGKTVVAALDYVRQIREGIRPRLLFVAHREELLDQARRTFRAVLQDPNFGEIWKADQEPTHWNHVFGSIQTLNNRQEEFRRRWPAGDWFEFLIVDEAHRGEAASYRFLLQDLKPRILLGLTATPERTDGGDIAKDFHGRFAAEIRLGEGIARERLVPFHYFGIAEGVPDLSQVSWHRGRYEQGALDRHLASQTFAEAILQAIFRVVGQPTKMRALCFCSSLHQAQFLADWFVTRGLQSRWLSGTHDGEQRREAIAALSEGDLQMVFTVDLFNEGIDIPLVDTVLFLRPTESLTVFLQQLGRGLRLAPGKTLLTVLDFVGRAQRNYDFTHKFQALLGTPKTGVRRQIEQGYPALPPGCAIILERQAEEEILRHIEAQIPSTSKKLLGKVAEMRSEGFGKFLDATGWEAEFLVHRGGLWYQMLDRLDSLGEPDSKRENSLREWIFTSVLCCDSPDLLTLWVQAIESQDLSHPGAELLTQLLAKNGMADTWSSQQEAWAWLLSVPHRRDEIVDWLRWKHDRLEARGLPVEGLTMLRQYCSYDFKTIAWGQGRATWGKTDVFQGGVHRVGDTVTKCWNLYVTVRKSEADYSRETLYRDWAISQDEFHWESPNDWFHAGGSGQRFLKEIEEGVPVYLFVRELKKDRWGRTPPYLFLGPVALIPESAVEERPISMRFRLFSPIPMVHFRVLCQEAVS